MFEYKPKEPGVSDQEHLETCLVERANELAQRRAPYHFLYSHLRDAGWMRKQKRISQQTYDEIQRILYP